MAHHHPRAGVTDLAADERSQFAGITGRASKKALLPKGFGTIEIESAVRIFSVSTASNVVWKKEVSPTNVG